MEYRVFGRTGLRVSVAGVGGGGASRLGLATGSSEDQAITLIRSAIDLGVNYFDTAENYGTEAVIGCALEGRRDDVVLSSKIAPRLADGSMLDRQGLRRGLEDALSRLRTDVVDVYHLHRPRAREYEYCRDELVPELLALRDEGKLRFTGITESTGSDGTHAMLQAALADNCWDVVMVGFNLFNQSACSTVFPQTIENNVAVEIMASARSHFSSSIGFTTEIARLVEAGELDRARIDSDIDTLFTQTRGPRSTAGVSYRFAAHQAGVHVVLVGTGSVEHLEENVRSLNSGPLPRDLHDRLVEMFGALDIAVQVPGRTVRP